VTRPPGSGGDPQRRASYVAPTGARGVLPRRQPRKRLRQMQDNPPGRAFDPDRELEQALAQRRDLGTGTRGPAGARRRSSWNRMYVASVSRTRNCLARNLEQLVRFISSQPLMQFLEPVLHVTPRGSRNRTRPGDGRRDS
jgi:hypothetical protein